MSNNSNTVLFSFCNETLKQNRRWKNVYLNQALGDNPISMNSGHGLMVFYIPKTYLFVEETVG